MSAVDLRGALLRITTPSGQPCEILFDFGAVDVSGYTWRGQVRSVPTSTDPDASFTFTNPTVYQLLATLSAVSVAALAPTTVWKYAIDQITPTPRQMFYGPLVVDQDVAR